MANFFIIIFDLIFLFAFRKGEILTFLTALRIWRLRFLKWSINFVLKRNLLFINRLNQRMVNNRGILSSFNIFKSLFQFLTFNLLRIQRKYHLFIKITFTAFTRINVETNLLSLLLLKFVGAIRGGCWYISFIIDLGNLRFGYWVK